MFEPSRLHEVNLETELPTQDENENKDLASQMYVDLMNQLKEKYSKVESIEKDVKREHKQLVSSITMLYGIVKSMENVFNETLEMPHEIITLFECLEAQMSEMMNIYVFSKLF